MQIIVTLVADLVLLSAALADPAADLAPPLTGTVLTLTARARLTVVALVGLTVTVTLPASGYVAVDRVALRFTRCGGPSSRETSAPDCGGRNHSARQEQTGRASRSSSPPRHRVPSSTWPPTSRS